MCYSFAAGASRNLGFDPWLRGTNGGEESAAAKSQTIALSRSKNSRAGVEIADMRAGVTRVDAVRI
jgi:hypothetical protein